MNTVQRHMDEIDAVKIGEEWLIELGRRRGADKVDLHRCEGNGGIRCVWKGRRMLAYYISVRDDMNWTVLSCHDLSQDLEPGAKSPLTPTPSEVGQEKDAIQRRDEALDIAEKFAGNLDPQNLAWALDQMCQVLLGAEYPSWVANRKAGEDGPETHEWHQGIKPEGI